MNGTVRRRGRFGCDFDGVRPPVHAQLEMFVGREISLGQVFPAARPAQLLLELSTLSPAMYETLECAAVGRGVASLAAPVLGSTDAARQGALTIWPVAGKRRSSAPDRCWVRSEAPCPTPARCVRAAT